MTSARTRSGQLFRYLWSTTLGLTASTVAGQSGDVGSNVHGKLTSHDVRENPGQHKALMTLVTFTMRTQNEDGPLTSATPSETSDENPKWARGSTGDSSKVVREKPIFN